MFFCTGLAKTLLKKSSQRNLKATKSILPKESKNPERLKK